MIMTICLLFEWKKMELNFGYNDDGDVVYKKN